MWGVGKRDAEFDLGLGLDLLGSEFEFDEDDEDDEDDEEIVDIHVKEAGKRFVMHFWDDDDGAPESHRVEQGKSQTANGDDPMDVDSDPIRTLDNSGSGRLDEELKRATQMEIDSDHDPQVSQPSETRWVGGVPDSPRLKDLDDFEEM